ncbi:dihydroorotase [Marivirga harenae]|uniref:dihydroorotase n=1 Tax=Marivirga harenae TaxID=2010992 RepID=UPI0026E0CA0A|nr:dihydroorotase [Marivirga harenae]WKV13956.1 dihydroorotase [Marivirga harenae]|tara:strand:+ start:278912 stop:280195 length:1284 start_codon:yes stop_codon:yes gene_type:complete
MRTYIKAVKIINSASQWHNQTIDLLLENGIIADINPSGEVEADQIIEAKELYASPSWLDMRVFSGEPGEEYREDFESLAKVLESGGFGAALLMPNTNPIIQNKADIKTILSYNRSQVSQFLPASAVTINCDGENLNEMLDVHHAGATAFTDGSQPLWNSDILVKSLQYLQKFDGLLINFPQDHKLALFGQMNEGKVSTGLGLKGIPHLAEEIVIQRDLELLRYAGGKLHFSCVSSAKSVELIRDAKARGLNVTCDVNIHHLILDDENLESFDTNYKVLPPLRTQKDIKGLIEGVNDGTIDVIVSGHQPYDQDHKKMEFDLAAFGIMGSQIVMPLYHKFLSKEIDLHTFISCIESNPKRILKHVNSKIEVGEEIDLTLFSLNETWRYDEHSNQSKSDNSPFMNTEFSAKVLGVFHQQHQYLDSKFTQS